MYEKSMIIVDDAPTARSAVEDGVALAGAVGAGQDDALCIAEAARKRRASVIVVGSAGRTAVMRLVAGSVIPGLITRAPVPAELRH